MSQRTIKPIPLAGNAFPASESLEAELRGQALGYNIERDRDGLLEELDGYLNKMDVSRLSEHSPESNQRQVLEQVRAAVAQGDYASAVAKMFTEGIEDTHQTMKLKMKLIRVYEGLRQGTTDMPEFKSAKDMIKNHEQDLMRFYDGKDKTRAMLVLENVINGKTGTTEIGLEELEESQRMVQRAIRAELKEHFQQVLPPHRLEGQSATGVKDQSYAHADITAKITDYYRIYEVLGVQIISQQELTAEKETKLEMERKHVLVSLDSLARHPGIAYPADMRQKFVEKISIMNIDQLQFLEMKIDSLKFGLKKKQVTAEHANAEIASWLGKKFDAAELKAEKADIHKADEKTKKDGLEDARNRIKNFFNNKEAA